MQCDAMGRVDEISERRECKKIIRTITKETYMA